MLDLSGRSGTPLPCKETFQGDQAFSELESQAIKNFVMARKDRIVTYLSYHR